MPLRVGERGESTLGPIHCLLKVSNTSKVVKEYVREEERPSEAGEKNQD
jgi:hypothetical protein